MLKLTTDNVSKQLKSDLPRQINILFYVPDQVRAFVNSNRRRLCSLLYFVHHNIYINKNNTRDY